MIKLFLTRTLNFTDVCSNLANAALKRVDHVLSRDGKTGNE